MDVALDRIGLFAGLSRAASAELAAIAQPFAVAAGETLFRQGDPPSGLFIVEQGLLEIATRVPGDEQERISRILPGEVVGEFALLDPGPRSAHVVALEVTRGRFLPARSFIAMLEERRQGAVEAVDRLRGLVAARTRATLERLASEFRAEQGELRRAPEVADHRPFAMPFATLHALGKFADFDDHQGERFLAGGETVAVARGGLIEAAGGDAEHADLVVRGAVRAAIPRGTMQDQVIIHGPGEWAGLVAMIDRGPHPLTLSAAEDTLLYRVSAATFAAWRKAPGPIESAVLAEVDRQLVRDQRRANRHLGRAVALERFNAAGGSA